MSDRARSLFNSISDQKLPLMSSVATQIQEMLMDPTSKISAISNLFKQDPVLASHLLQTANAKSRQHKIINFEHAITYLGRNAVSEMTGLAAMRQFNFATNQYNIHDYWRSSLLTGLISEKIRGLFGMDITADQAFLCGSIANLGKMVGAIMLPDSIDKVYQNTNQIDTQMPWITYEKQNGIQSHEVLGEIGVSFWGLPVFLFEAINHHSYEDDARLSALSNLAVNLTHWISDEPLRIEESELQRHRDSLGLTDEKLLKLTTALRPLHKQVENIIETNGEMSK